MRFKRALITGCGGMLGNAIYPYFKSRVGEILATDKVVSDGWLERLDVRDAPRLEQVFADYRPDLVLHLAAETDLEYCETHADVARDTNELATCTLAGLAERFDATLVYISTAGVFDGKKHGPYTESDRPNPIMVYGRTKHAGERHAVSSCSHTYVVRAGWMMGGGAGKEKKFIYKILRQIDAGCKEIFAVNDRWGTPTYTYDFAKNLLLLLETGKYGVYHMVCGGTGTRYHVAREILHICKRSEIKLTAVPSEYFKEEYFAPRPYSEMMLNENLSSLGINIMRPWKVALADYISNYFAHCLSGSPGDVTRALR